MDPFKTIRVLEFLQNVRIVQEFSGKPGVYRLFHPRRSIPRIGGVDKRGVLYIGKGEDLGERLRQLRRGFQKAKTGIETDHVGAMRYNAARFALKSKYRLKDIELDVFTFASHEKAKDYEDRLLLDYFKEFGEVPPLNSTLKLYPGGILRPELRLQQ